jgi:hypothetical protein
MLYPRIIWREVRGATARNHLWFIEIEPALLRICEARR